MKDPAALLYIDKWLVSTKGMKASARGWYLNLILHQYDKGSLPNNIEDLADFADVKHSEFEEFKQVFEQVLKQKFVENSEGRLINEFAQEIIIKRESFKDKRSESGKWSYILKYIRKNHLNNKDFELFLKDNINLNFDTKNEQVLEQVFKQNYELYINENEDKDIITNSSNNNEPNFEKLESTPYTPEKKYSDDEVIEQFKNHKIEFLKQQHANEQFCMSKRIPLESLESVLNDFNTSKIGDGQTPSKNIAEYRKWVSNWFNKIPEDIKANYRIRKRQVNN